MTISVLIADWPVIIQGAMGSALFMLLLFLGQWLTRFVANKVKIDKETSEFFALLAWSHGDPYQKRSTYGFFACLYAAVHYFLKAMIILVTTWLLTPLGVVFVAVGHIICAYYLFRALSCVPHLSGLGDVDDRLDDIMAESDRNDS